MRPQLRSWQGYFAEPTSERGCFERTHLHLIWLSRVLLLEDGNICSTEASCSVRSTTQCTAPRNPVILSSLSYSHQLYTGPYPIPCKSNQKFYITRVEKFSKKIYHTPRPHKFSGDLQVRNPLLFNN